MDAWIPATICGILVLGALSMLLLAYFWDTQVVFLNVPCSIILIAGTFVAALCDCTSSVVYWPFVGTLAPSALAGLAMGENLSGVAASIVSWLGLTPRGSFVSLAVVLGVSGVAFHLLLGITQSPSSADFRSTKMSLLDVETTRAVSPRIPFLLVGLMSFYENAVLPTVLPFATARYSLQDYHVAATLPLGSFLVLSVAVFTPSRAILVVVAVAASCAVGLILCVGSGRVDVGGTAIVAMVCFVKAVVAYCKAASMCNLKLGAGSAEATQTHLEAAGVTMQACSFVGAVLMFILIHNTAFFQK